MDYKTVLKSVKKFFTTQIGLDTDLIEGVKAGDIAKVKKAVEDGANPSAVSREWDAKSGLMLAIEAGNLEMLKTLLELKADPNAQVGYSDRKPLFDAINKGANDFAIALVEAGANINAADYHKNTGFMLAVATKNKTLTDYFMTKGAKLDTVNSKGWSPLTYAVRNGDVETINALLAKKVRTDRKDEDGNSLLEITRLYDRPEAAKALYAHYDSLIPAWQKVKDEDSVAHIHVMRDTGYKLTEVFNLRTNRLTTITHNFETGRDETVSRGLNDGDKVAVAEATAQLAALKKPATPAPAPVPQAA